MHRFIYNGRNSRDFGIVLSGEDTWRKAVPDLERKQIPGRNGDLVLSNQRYNNVKLSYHAGIIHDFEKNYTALSNFLLSNPGYHRLEDSYHPEYYRMALLEGDIEPKLTAYHREGEIDLTFSCMPQMYLKSGEQQKTFTQGGSINNPTLYVARPLLQVYGIGRFAINDDIVNITYAEVFTDIDCELEDAYKGSANWNAYIELSNNEFPKLNPGANQIALMTGIEKIEMIPRWWCL